ncbi:TPA_asm: M [Durio betacytorhabdovirus 1]|nr:TPA_asm: M [Durio betacytorhabdovirus 1]
MAKIYALKLDINYTVSSSAMYVANKIDKSVFESCFDKGGVNSESNKLLCDWFNWFLTHCSKHYTYSENNNLSVDVERAVNREYTFQNEVIIRSMIEFPSIDITSVHSTSKILHKNIVVAVYNLNIKDLRTLELSHEAAAKYISLDPKLLIDSTYSGVKEGTSTGITMPVTPKIK